MKTQQAAIGKWQGILKHLGMDDAYLQNRHGACPMCGGKDRYRFDDKDGQGTYFCSGCGAGDGIKLAMEFTGKDFKTIAAEIDSFVGNIQRQEIKPRPKDNGRINWITRNAYPAKDSKEVMRYLHNRNLPCSSGLLAIDAMKYYEDGKLIGTFPVMVGAFKAAQGDLITYHVTYIKDGEKAPVSASKKLLSPLSDMSGGVIRTCGMYSHIGIAEGIETSLAVMKKYNVPCHASGNAIMMEKFVPPEGVRKVTIFADNDANYAGHKSAYALAHKLSLLNIEVSVTIPEQIGDFAD